MFVSERLKMSTTLIAWLWNHHENMPILFWPPSTPLIYSKTGVTGVYIILLISAQNHILWVLVRTASSRRFERVPTIYVLSRNMKNIRLFIWKFSGFRDEVFNIFILVCFRNDDTGVSDNICGNKERPYTVELQRLEHIFDHGNLFNICECSSHWGLIIASGQETNRW